MWVTKASRRPGRYCICLSRGTDDHGELIERAGGEVAGHRGRLPRDGRAGSLVRSFAALLTPDSGNDGKLRQWITTAHAADLPHVHAFARGLDLDMQAATAALTLPHHNGRTEGVNTRTKMIKRQMYRRAGFALLCHRILLS